MKFMLVVRGFGKIGDAKFGINDLTCFAGHNSTGKSYVSRVLYCIFSALAASPLQYYYANLAGKLGRRVGGIRDEIGRNLSYSANLDDKAMDQFSRIIDEIREVALRIEAADTCSNRHAATTADESYKKLFTPLLDRMPLLEDAVTSMAGRSRLASSWAGDEDGSNVYIKDIRDAFSVVKGRLALPCDKKVESGYLAIITENLYDNFQVGSLRELIGFGSDAGANVSLEMGKACVSLRIDAAGVLDGKVDMGFMGYISNAIYLTSPLSWMMQRTLAAAPVRKYLGRNSYLGGVPKYIHDSFITLGYECIDEPDAHLSSIVADIEADIGGEIKYDALRRKLEFYEKDASGAGEGADGSRGISLLLTASGIVQLGMLAFFIKNRTIDRGTILFMDEPEAHLHTSWEEKLMDVIYRLKEHGVKIVMTTHSPTIMQKLELEVNKHKSWDSVSLNLFVAGGKFDNASSSYKSVSKAIARNMNEAPYQMFLEE